MEVKLIDVMGSDLTVCNAARRSFGMGYDTWSEIPRSLRGRSDPELIQDLAKDKHFLPFRHPHVMLSCDAPIPVARQLGKHQVGLEWSEVSRRYKYKDIQFYWLKDKWRSKPKDIRQGSGKLLPVEQQQKLNALELVVINTCADAYEQALALDASPEQARFLLPQSMEVYWTWTGSLLAMAHLYKQRTDEHAQLETKEFALQVGKIMENLFPVSWKALTE